MCCHFSSGGSSLAKRASRDEENRLGLAGTELGVRAIRTNYDGARSSLHATTSPRRGETKTRRAASMQRKKENAIEPTSQQQLAFNFLRRGTCAPRAGQCASFVLNSYQSALIFE